MNMKMEYVLDAWQRHLNSDPNSVVLSDSLGHDLTRTQTDEMAGRVYAYLKKIGAGTDDFVMIDLERGVKPVVAVLGVLKSGCAFTLVEYNYAQDRKDYIAKDCNAKVIISEDNWAEIMNLDPKSGYIEADDHDACLSVYTSGTTGTPKGVVHEYGQLKMEMISEQNPDGRWYENRSTRWGNVAPLNFVASLKIIVHFLYCGGHLYILDYDTVKNPKKLASYLLLNRINETFLSPSLLRMKGSDMGPFMKYVYTGAEPANDVMLKGGTLLNIYTMSESFFTVSEFVVDQAYDVCPIGKPKFDLQIKLLKDNGELAENGEIGEICFYNPYCRGYQNLEEENGKHFIDGYFHTGDLGVYENGQYILKGRSDDMVKINGNRIEPGEIEAVCKNTLNLSWCAAKGYEEGFVALYFTDDVNIDGEKARKELEEKLPYYMIPSHYIHVDQIPLTKSGKLDRKSLPYPKVTIRKEYVAPRNEFEEKLAAIFEKSLEIDRVSIKDDFFSLGGNSLKAMEVLSEMDMDSLTMSIFYRGRTIEKIAELHQYALAHFMSEEEKEEEGRKHHYPLNYLQGLLWNGTNNGTYDFIAAYRLSPLLPLQKVQKALNAYIKTNSSFNMHMVKENGVPLQAYSPVSPIVEIENLSEKEVKELKTTFIRPFKYGEPLFRCRMIRTKLHSYIFIQMSHVISDGAGVHLMLKDLIKVYEGKEIKPTRYFAFAFDQQIPVDEELFNEAREYYDKKLSPKTRMRNLVKDSDTGAAGQGVARNVYIDLEKITSILPRYNTTIGGFVNALGLLAANNYNKKSTIICPVYENRSPNESIAGLRHIHCAIGFTKKHDNLLDMFEDINEQQFNYIKRSYYNYAEYVEVDDDYSNFTISYVADWFDNSAGGAVGRLLGKPIELVNTFNDGTGRPGLNLAVSHQGEKLLIQFQYDKRFLSEENAERFCKMLEYAAAEILEGRIPDYSTVRI